MIIKYPSVDNTSIGGCVKPPLRFSVSFKVSSFVLEGR